MSSRNRKRIAVFLYSLQDMGGAVRVAVNLANRCAEDYEVLVVELGLSGHSAFPLDSRICVRSLNAAEGRLRDHVKNAVVPLARELKSFKADLVLGICAEESAVSAAAAKLIGIPGIFCDHGALINQLDDRTTTILRRLCSMLSAATVVLTEQSRCDYLKLFNAQPDKVFCIPNWIPSVLADYPACSDISQKRMIWAGRFDHEKGVDKLCDIAEKVLPTHPDWTWDVYGSSVLDEEPFDIEREIEERGLAGRLRLCGTYDDITEVFPKYSIGTLTSYREGLPLFLLEALPFGLPTISFDIQTGPRDIIVNGTNGYLVEPYDCDAYAHTLSALMESEFERSLLQLGALERCMLFEQESVYAMWRKLFDRFGV